MDYFDRDVLLLGNLCHMFLLLFWLMWLLLVLSHLECCPVIYSRKKKNPENEQNGEARCVLQRPFWSYEGENHETTSSWGTGACLDMMRQEMKVFDENSSVTSLHVAAKVIKLINLEILWIHRLTVMELQWSAGGRRCCNNWREYVWKCFCCDRKGCVCVGDGGGVGTMYAFISVSGKEMNKKTHRNVSFSRRKSLSPGKQWSGPGVATNCTWT